MICSRFDFSATAIASHKDLEAQSAEVAVVIAEQRSSDITAADRHIIVAKSMAGDCTISSLTHTRTHAHTYTRARARTPPQQQQLINFYNTTQSFETHFNVF